MSHASVTVVLVASSGPSLLTNSSRFCESPKNHGPASGLAGTSPSVRSAALVVGVMARSTMLSAVLGSSSWATASRTNRWPVNVVSRGISDTTIVLDPPTLTPPTRQRRKGPPLVPAGSTEQPGEGASSQVSGWKLVRNRLVSTTAPTALSGPVLVTVSSNSLG